MSDAESSRESQPHVPVLVQPVSQDRGWSSLGWGVAALLMVIYYPLAVIFAILAISIGFNVYRQGKSRDEWPAVVGMALGGMALSSPLLLIATPFLVATFAF